jgi:hypothetical protein
MTPVVRPSLDGSAGGAPLRLLLAVGGDFLGRWLPACIAAALPQTDCRFVGQLWSSGGHVRRIGRPYRSWPWATPQGLVRHALPNVTDLQFRGLRADGIDNRVQRAYDTLWQLAEREFADFPPDAVVYLTAESALGHVLDDLARQHGIPAVGLQTSFLRRALLVHPYGAYWQQALAAAALEDPALPAACPETALRPGPATASPQMQAPRTQLWVGRAERLLRAASGAPCFDRVGPLLATLRHAAAARPGGFPVLGSEDIGEHPPERLVLVALHRPVLAAGEPDWLDLLRFALEATPADMPLVVRPHPDESARPVPPALLQALRARGVRVSRPGRGAGLPALLKRAQAVLTLCSAAGMQALEAGVPTVALGPAFYARPGLAHRATPAEAGEVRARIAEHRLLPPDAAMLQRFVQWIEAHLAAPMPDRTDMVVPATALAARITAVSAAYAHAHRTTTCEP